MKLIKFLFILLLIDSGNANACSCIFISDDEFVSATVKRYDFIALVKIKSVKVQSFIIGKSSTKSDFAQIEIIELFKGNKVDSIHIRGIGTSCDMGVRPGAEWLIYGGESNTYYSTNSCTHSTQNSANNWEINQPFFLTRLYFLQKHFNHPLPKLKDGIHETFFPDKQLKSRYTVINNKIERDFYYLSENEKPGIIYNYQFKDGVLHGNSYKIGIEHKWISVSKYNNGELTETTSYNISDSIGIQIDFTNPHSIASSVRRQKAFQYQQLFLPDKSVLTKSYHQDNTFNSIEHKDSTGKTLFLLRYSEDGKLEGNLVLDQNSGISTFIGYYSSGTIERKVIRRPDRTQTSYFYNPDGTLKNVRED
jgi:antitoxin component YwqK of YwqJK toxin-antitoxin module